MCFARLLWADEFLCREAGGPKKRAVWGELELWGMKEIREKRREVTFNMYLFYRTLLNWLLVFIVPSSSSF